VSKSSNAFGTVNADASRQVSAPGSASAETGAVKYSSMDSAA
jgi:hypothetical protein